MKKQGQCGCCNSLNINYCESTLLDESIGYEFICDDCNESGIEWHNIIYSETVMQKNRIECTQ